METYKIGNQITGIIRAFAPGILGNEEMTYPNQPYTVLDGVSATLSFDDIGSDIKNDYRLMYHNTSNLNEIKISDVKLTDKIMNLIFLKSERKMAHSFENCHSDDNKMIFLTINAPVIYDVFVFDINQQVEHHYDELTLDNPIIVNNANVPYLIFYSYKKTQAFELQQSNNQYISLDLQITGNINDETSTMWVHIDKCGIQVDRNLYLSNEINSADITFKVINDRDTNNYITIK